MSRDAEPETRAEPGGKKLFVESKPLRWFKRKEKSRDWEDFYVNRWQHDTVTRSSHGVNCSGSCSWQVFTKNGLICWELQQIDYPQIRSDTPNHEPRGCQRGMSTSWYPYSPVRVKHPYVRGKLLDFYRSERGKGKDPVEAWGAIVEDPQRSREYKKRRGKAGWHRVKWDEAVEIVAAAQIYTIKKYGPDHMAAFSPIPAMSMVSWISGERLAGLQGAPILSFYEWYHDLPHVMPTIWGDQTDVAESADWYQSAYWMVVGSNMPMTRTPDAHFASEFKYNGGKLVNLSSDYSDVTKFADTWVPVEPGTDAAFLNSCIHVILKEFYVEREVPYFREYVKKYTNLPFLVKLEPQGEHYWTGRFVRASDISEYSDEENADGKLLLMDSKTERLVLPKGTIGFRWGKDRGKWNLNMESAKTGKKYDPILTFHGKGKDVLQVTFADFTDTFDLKLNKSSGQWREAKSVLRGVPAWKIETKDGEQWVTTAFDLLMAQFGVSRGLEGDYPEGYDDPKPCTPAWQEQQTGVDRKLAIRIAREWAETAEKTKGRCLFITGSGVLHWYHGGTITYRAEATMGIITGCMGKNGGGFNHYVGTEKIRNYAAVPTLGTAKDWTGPPRLMNSTSYWYFHSDQYRYDAMTLDPLLHPDAKKIRRYNHAADMNVLAVRNGWLPFYPQFDKRNPLDVAKEAQDAGAKTDEEIASYVGKKLVEGKLDFGIHDVDAVENFPKVLTIWRGNLVGTSMRGHEIFLKHFLGTHHNVLGGDRAKGLTKQVKWREEAPEGKVDLMVNCNIRMDSSANYSDIVLPSAHWYEKYDLTCTDLHTFFHPFTPAHEPAWESRHDWDAFKAIAKKFSELAEKYFPKPVKDVVLTPLMTDTPDEIANLKGEMFDWKEGDVKPVPGKTMPNIKVVERDYTKVYERYVTLGPEVTKPNGYGAKGINCDLTPIYEDLKENFLVGEKYGRPSLERPEHVAEVILRISPETDGKTSRILWETLEEQTGLDFSEIYGPQEEVHINFKDIISQPRRTLNSPHWSGMETFVGEREERDKKAEARTYSPWTLNVDMMKPWHTLTGRQEVFWDHEAYRELGESHLNYKPPVDTVAIGDINLERLKKDKEKVGIFRFLTPHGKWQIHSNFRDSWQMSNLSRGGPDAWINNEAAAKLDIKDNDWVELYTENGIQVCRAIVTHKMPRDAVIVYHQVERHVNVPFSKKAIEEGCSDLRGGNNNATTRIMQNPATMIGGYANWTYFINYWGTSPSERDMPVALRRMPLEKGEKPIYQEKDLGVKR